MPSHQEFVSSTLQSGFCPNFFISSVNLWGEQILGKSVERVPIQAKIGCKIIEKTLQRDISMTFLPLRVKSEILLQHLFALSPSKFYTRAVLLLLVVESVALSSLPVIVLGIAVAIQTTVSWILGILICLPLIIIYGTILLLARHLFTYFY